MGIGTYFVGLVLSGLVAFVLGAIIRWSTAHWRPTSALSWQNLFRAILRALPIAIAFAPSLLMKRGLGVLIPASLTIFAEIQALVSRSHPLDTDDRKNLTNAVGSFIFVWGASLVVFFFRQSSAIEKQAQNNPRQENA